jgi:plasmid stabilization system protein ParE
VNIVFLESAKDELNEAIEHYAQQKEGLGEEFAAEVRGTAQLIARFPEGWTKLSKNARMCRTKRFPYGLVYQVRQNEILIVAVAHLHCKPGYWKDRLR